MGVRKFVCFYACLSLCLSHSLYICYVFLYIQIPCVLRLLRFTGPFWVARDARSCAQSELVLAGTWRIYVVRVCNLCVHTTTTQKRQTPSSSDAAVACLLFFVVVVVVVVNCAHGAHISLMLVSNRKAFRRIRLCLF